MGTLPHAITETGASPKAFSHALQACWEKLGPEHCLPVLAISAAHAATFSCRSAAHTISDRWGPPRGSFIGAS